MPGMTTAAFIATYRSNLLKATQFVVEVVSNGFILNSGSRMAPKSEVYTSEEQLVAGLKIAIAESQAVPAHTQHNTDLAASLLQSLQGPDTDVVN